MAIYYVSKQNGIDTQTGLSIDQAWATIGKAGTVAQTGDTVYIGPGIYRESFVATKYGSQANPIKYIGDPNCKSLTSDKPGIVRWTAANNAEYSTTGTNNYHINMNSRNWYEFYNLTIDGVQNASFTGGAMSPNAVTVNNSSSNYNIKLFNCNVYGSIYCVNRCYVNDCFIIGGYSAIAGCTAVNSVLMAGSIAAGDSPCFLTGCLIFSGTNGISTSSMATNCSFVSCQTAVANSSSAYNCFSFGCYSNAQTIGNTNKGILQNFYSTYHVYLTSSTVAVSSVQNGYYGMGYASITGSSTVQPTNWERKPIFLLKPNFKNDIKKLFDPYIINGLTGLSSSIYPLTSDLLGRYRRSDNADLGPYVLSNVQEKWTSDYYYSNPPGFYFTDSSQKIIDVYASTGDLTISAWVKDTSGDQFDIVLRGDHIAETTWSSDSSGDWQIASLSASITGCDQKLKLILYNVNAPTTGIVSDIRIY